MAAKFRPASTVSWVALTVAMASLALSVFTYLRVGREDPALVTRTMSDRLSAYEQRVSVLRALSSLEDIRAAIDAGERPADTKNRLSEIRRDLTVAFRESDQHARSAWKSVDASMAALLTGADGSRDTFLNVLDTALETMKTQLAEVSDRE